MIDFQVRLIEFHNGRIKEAVTANEDGSYTIFIEATLSRQEQREACNHALGHIFNNDFEKKNANLIEYYAHQL